MADRIVEIKNNIVQILPCQEDLDRLKIQGLNGTVFYGVECRKPALEKEERQFLYKLHLFSLYNYITKEYDYRFYRWIAMWNTEVYHGKYDTIEEAIESVLKRGWKVSQIGNQANDLIIYRVLHSTEGTK